MTKALHSRRSVLASLGSTLALTACGSTFVETGRPLGAHLDEGQFGGPTRSNIGVHNGDIQWAEILGERFANSVPTTINFAFNSAELDAEARNILAQQAAFIRNFPEVRFSVYGHTDAVGSNGYNQRLGRRRARAAVNFLVSQGVSRHRLAALVSLGETQPVVATDMEERRNRRTVTEVSGFMENDPMVLDGRYAEIIYRSYRSGVGGVDGGGGGAPG
ncbi:OmpA family protein [Jannaschia sp. CCS1]|uniref:OmpA family protein n=1 Tax=Jannaschia sp. (strain CCS1) TaxID=290400 RepID=UPI000053DBD9|nr:OmpA family protein [Jannaschia sp. CCS1]ABD53913.1 OmpA/MotB [Jannaschia sp. CCS1]